MSPHSQGLDEPRKSHVEFRMCSTLEHQTKGFSIFDGHTHNPQNNYSSLFRVDFITSSFHTIFPKNKHRLELSLL